MQRQGSGAAGAQQRTDTETEAAEAAQHSGGMPVVTCRRLSRATLYYSSSLAEICCTWTLEIAILKSLEVEPC